ncbi:hypothetical protein QE109_03025 [Fusibacter bizertensis]|uniref:LytR/CpsA/Psr regulator C-terminal domain-containing protein n=1 Tax=Fusibacter bizertensis TaxID=1488331 RepID=A0ABT6N9L4_9FIRM|nr:hypothetical protein [Fusibacter bizertensis]MDH8677103.1 hypothetical protein [Fusibacter bizertensis]
MSERMNELFTLTQKAQKMEMINEEIALGIYLDIFDNYTPKISKTYESAIRLLEKRQRYVEAEVICSKAIELIKADEISGTLDKFETIKERLDRKIMELSPADIKPQRKKFKLTKTHLILLVVILALIFMILKFTTPFDDLNVDLDGKESLNGGEGVYKVTTESSELTYPVTEAMIDIATSELKKNIDVSDASVIPQDNTLGIAIIIKPGTSQERAVELTEAYLKSLSGAAAAAYSDLKAPTKETLGELYDYYELVITVGTSTKPEDFIAKGTKVRGASSIYWRNMDNQ